MVELFGGALEMVLPFGDLLDVSLMRQVPDNQEVFVDKHSDLSVIVELLEFEQSMTLKTHFAHLAEDNGASSFNIISIQDKCLYGTQSASKFNKESEDIVHVFLGLERLPEHQTDILVSVNSPKCASITLAQFIEMFETLSVKDTCIFHNQ